MIARGQLRDLERKLDQTRGTMARQRVLKQLWKLQSEVPQGDYSEPASEPARRPSSVAA